MHLLQQHGFTVKKSGCLPVLQIFLQLTTFDAPRNEKYDPEVQQLIYSVPRPLQTVVKGKGEATLVQHF